MMKGQSRVLTFVDSAVKIKGAGFEERGLLETMDQTKDDYPRLLRVQSEGK